MELWYYNPLEEDWFRILSYMNGSYISYVSGVVGSMISIHLEHQELVKRFNKELS